MKKDKEPSGFVSRSVLGRKTITLWDTLLSKLFKKDARSYHKGKRLLQQKRKNTQLATFFSQYSRFGTKRGIVCTVTQFPEDTMLLREELENIHTHYANKHMRELISADMWGKAVAYRELAPGDSIPFSSIHQSSQIEMRVDTCFDLWNEVRAFGCISTAGESILLFRGTDLSFLTKSGRASMLSDLDPDGPGRKLFEASQDALEEWLWNERKQGRETRVIGHSLGGSLACYALIDFPHLISARCTSYATNYPGVNEALALKWEQLEKKPAFLGIVSEGDAVSKCGHLISKTVLFTPEKEIPPMQSHELLFGAETPFSLFEVNIHDENQTKSRTFISRVHRGFSTVLYQLGLKHILPKKKDDPKDLT